MYLVFRSSLSLGFQIYFQDLILLLWDLTKITKQPKKLFCILYIHGEYSKFRISYVLVIFRV